MGMELPSSRPPLLPGSFFLGSMSGEESLESEELEEEEVRLEEPDEELEEELDERALCRFFVFLAAGCGSGLGLESFPPPRPVPPLFFCAPASSLDFSSSLPEVPAAVSGPGTFLASRLLPGVGGLLGSLPAGAADSASLAPFPLGSELCSTGSRGIGLGSLAQGGKAPV